MLDLYFVEVPIADLVAISLFASPWIAMIWCLPRYIRGESSLYVVRWIKVLIVLAIGILILYAFTKKLFLFLP